MSHYRMKVGFGLAESDGEAWGEDEIRAADCRDFSDRDRGDLGSAGDQCAAWEFYDGADAMGLPGRDCGYCRRGAADCGAAHEEG